MRLTSALSIGSAITLLAACGAAPVSPVAPVATEQPDCTGATFIDDARLRTAAQLRGSTNAQVSFESGNTLVKLENPFFSGTVTADTATFTVPKLTSVAAVTVVGSASPLGSHDEANPLATPGVHLTVPISVSCAPGIAPQTPVALQTEAPGDSFTPASFTCNANTAVQVIVKRDWDGGNIHDLETVAAMNEYIQMKLVSTGGGCQARLPIKKQ